MAPYQTPQNFPSYHTHIIFFTLPPEKSHRSHDWVVRVVVSQVQYCITKKKSIARSYLIVAAFVPIAPEVKTWFPLSTKAYASSSIIYNGVHTTKRIISRLRTQPETSFPATPSTIQNTNETRVDTFEKINATVHCPS